MLLVQFLYLTRITCYPNSMVFISFIKRTPSLLNEKCNKRIVCLHPTDCSLSGMDIFISLPQLNHIKIVFCHQESGIPTAVGRFPSAFGNSCQSGDSHSTSLHPARESPGAAVSTSLQDNWDNVLVHRDACWTWLQGGGFMSAE